MLYVRVNENRRVCDASYGDGHIENGIMVEIPENWDWEHISNWTLIDGNLILDLL